ncbi:hypothetical protein M885DRAFT_529166 [Pelagophyceae sp. CCMP2097]|nr:hypothetical protein M885DRAFT_529166 [Pelagophyceae sp. CCMP2097]
MGGDVAAAEAYRASCLPRKVVSAKAVEGFRRANEGETVDAATGVAPQLYPLSLCDGEVFSHLDSFGVGVSMYFRQLVYLFATILTCALVLLVSQVYNARRCTHDALKPAYDNAGLVFGSAAGCYPRDLSVSHNLIPDIIVCGIIVAFMLAANSLQATFEARIDDARQTPSDYSIVVSNPPEHVLDPEAYRSFFAGEWQDDVVAVTLSKNNGEVLTLLAERRAFADDVRDFDAAGTADVSLGIFSRLVQPFLYPYGLLMTRSYAEAQLAAGEVPLRAIFADCAAGGNKLKPDRVFVTFNTEAMQRRALETFAVSEGLRLWSNLTGIESERIPVAFEGVVLKVSQPVEPTEIFWHNSHYTWVNRAVRVTCALAATGLFLVALVQLCVALEGTWQFALSLFITLVNTALPLGLRALTDAVEKHRDFGDHQDSMFVKLIFARWVNTAISVFVAYPQRARLSAMALQQIMLILIADALFAPLLRLVDVYDLFMRYVVSPRAPSQRIMNLHWRGAEWNLADRYTDVSKTIFVGLFYAAALPVGLFATAGAIVTTFLVDRYCLLRTWRRIPEVDAQLANRTTGVIAIIVFVHFWASLNFFINWGEYFYDAFEDAEDYDERGMGSTADCFAGFLRCSVPAGKSLTHAMRVSQKVYYYFGILAFIIAVWKFAAGDVVKKLLRLCFEKSARSKETIPTPFRVIPMRQAYVPIVRAATLEHRLIAAQIVGVPFDLLPCSNAANFQAVQLATVEEVLPLLAAGSTRADAERVIDEIFGVVKYYPPPAKAESFSEHRPAKPPAAAVVVPVAPPSPPAPEAPPQPKLAAFAQMFSVEAPPLPPPPPQLPPGWEMQVDASGRPFYIDHVHHVTSWELP